MRIIKHIQNIEDSNNPLNEYLADHDIYCHTENMNGEVNGFTYISGRGKRYVVINECLSNQAKLKTVFHELHHIAEDSNLNDSFIGMDCIGMDFEKKADRHAEHDVKIIESFTKGGIE